MSNPNNAIQPIELFKVLSDPTRLKLFQILYKKEARCVGELVDMLDQPQPTISRHLNHLKKLGILSCVRDGTWMWYKVSNDTPDWCATILETTYQTLKEQNAPIKELSTAHSADA
ncbi:helix-turn-helix transcriptional regulator [uncultured Psychrobacter sp.]|uniref:ArsR/SmtB family transcription factor n=1 Tax=uncultured Psychrobacter sp. TaxID=259303 RepID=UPI002624D929|nr:metalloregulator ArsR/SmtB family transcription factor [uncultured Psychrobacter sp.]